MPFALMLFTGFSQYSYAQTTNVQAYGFVNSLTDHDIVSVSDANYTDINYWVNNIVQSTVNTFGWAGQFGQPETHVANLPPISQLGSLNTPTSWDSDNGESFAASSINTIVLNTANFTQASPPEEPIQEGFIEESALELIESLFDYTNEEIPNMNYYIQSGWQEVLANDYPPSEQEINNFHNGLLGVAIDYDLWFIDLQDLLIESRPELNPRLIPQRSIISGIYTDILDNQIPFIEAYEDNAPHGTPSTYFLAGLINYIAFFEEQVPDDYAPTPSAEIYPIILNNLTAIKNYIWQELNAFNFQNGDSRVFYSEISSVNGIEKAFDNLKIVPNPVEDYFRIKNLPNTTLTLSILDLNGRILKTFNEKKVSESFDLAQLKRGLYLLRLITEDGNTITKKLYKI